MATFPALAQGTQPNDTYQSDVATSGPSHQYRFNDPSGTEVADDVGSCKAESSATFGPSLGHQGPFAGSKAAEFGGIGSYSLSCYPLQEDTAFTAEGWVDWTSMSAGMNQSIFDFASGTSYVILTPSATSSKHLEFDIHAGTTTATVAASKALKMNAWNYLAVTETTAGKLTLYLNGVSVASATTALYPASLGSSVAQRYFAWSEVPSQRGYNGSLSNIAFYNKALNSSEVETHYDDGERPGNTAVPAISGTAREGGVLTTTSGSWTGLEPISFEYSWARCSGSSCTAITGATSANYTATEADVAYTLKATVKAKNALGSETASGESTQIEGKPILTAPPSLSGEPKVGRALEASASWRAFPAAEISYEWQSCKGTACTAISGASNSRYTVSETDVGHRLRAIITASNTRGSAIAESTETAAVGAGSPLNQTSPSITGGIHDGELLTATSGKWAGNTPISYTYTWKRCATPTTCTQAQTGTSPNYTLSALDVGKTIKVLVTAENGISPAGTAESTPTAIILAMPPTNTAAPAVTGTFQDEHLLIVSPGSWSGTAPIEYSYQWARCSTSGTECENITAATHSEYAAVAADVGHKLRATVTATNAGGSQSTTATSSTTVSAAPPRSTTPPSLEGEPRTESSIVANPGAWGGTPTLVYSYRWERCNPNGSGCSAITGATSSSYAPTHEDVGLALRARVTATNTAGASSAATAVSTPVILVETPSISEAPTISGVPKTGQRLTGSSGKWASPNPLSYSYQWKRCTGPGDETCATIEGATSNTYTLSASDPIGDSFRVTVTAANAYGLSATSTSSPRYLPATVRTTEYTYDADGDQTSKTEAAGHTTSYGYGPEDELTKTTEPDGSVTEASYDTAGRLSSQIDANKHTTKYTEDALGETTEREDPLKHRTKMRYDAAGNLIALTDAAERTTTYTYDAANRLTKTSYASEATPSVKYQYDADGNRVKAEDATGTSEYEYDLLDRLTQTKDAHGDIVKYRLDLGNESTELTYPNGKTVTREYDAAGRLANVEDWLGHRTTFHYDADSQLTKTVFPANTDEYTYDDADLPIATNIKKGSEALASLSYTRNSNSTVASTTQSGLPGSEAIEYAYDSNNRLSREGTDTFKYDAAGNPTTTPGSTNTFNEGDELTASTTTEYAYNALGERTTANPSGGPGTHYAYDEAGNLIAAERTAEGATPAIHDAFTYDASGLRVSQTIGTASTTYMTWEPTEGVPLLLTDGSNNYIYGPEEDPIEQINNTTGTVTYLHHDQQGSTRLITNSTGTVTGKCTYAAYGTPTCEGSATTPLGYDGQYTSSDTGLIYLRARVYDPAAAQFLSVDPLDAITGERYSYTGDDPNNYTDPTGLIFDIPGTPSWSQIGTRVSGFFDGLTSPIFGGTAALRAAFGLNGGLDECSTEYQLAKKIGLGDVAVGAGVSAGAGVVTAIAGAGGASAGAAEGVEIASPEFVNSIVESTGHVWPSLARAVILPAVGSAGLTWLAGQFFSGDMPASCGCGG